MLPVHYGGKKSSRFRLNAEGHIRECRLSTHNTHPFTFIDPCNSGKRRRAACAAFRRLPTRAWLRVVVMRMRFSWKERDAAWTLLQFRQHFDKSVHEDALQLHLKDTLRALLCRIMPDKETRGIVARTSGARCGDNLHRATRQDCELMMAHLLEHHPVCVRVSETGLLVQTAHLYLRRRRGEDDDALAW